MRPSARIGKIIKTLERRYPEVKTQLNYNTPFELLIATILSAQCTDKQVNIVTKKLFDQLKTPYDFAEASDELIEKLIKPTGFFRNKARNIKNCSKVIAEKYNGKVPDSLEELISLPGVGRKTANVVLGAAFGIPGIVVDTHVARISQRLKFSNNNDPVKIEFDLMKIIPEKEWNDFCLRLIYFGREICRAKKPLCMVCPVTNLCDYPFKTK